MTDGNGVAEALLGLDGFRVLEVTEDPAVLVIVAETDVRVVCCRRCGVRAEAQDRMRIAIRDLNCRITSSITRIRHSFESPIE